MFGPNLLKSKHFSEVAYININHANNIRFKNINLATIVSCKIQPQLSFGSIFFNDKRFFGVKRVVQKRSNANFKNVFKMCSLRNVASS